MQWPGIRLHNPFLCKLNCATYNLKVTGGGKPLDFSNTCSEKIELNFNVHTNRTSVGSCGLVSGVRERGGVWWREAGQDETDCNRLHWEDGW